MKAIFISCLVLLATSFSDYENLLIGFLQGADMMGSVIPMKCNPALSNFKNHYSFDNSWDSIISDSLVVSQTCEFKPAVEMLTIFKNSDDLKTKAFSEIDLAIASSKIQPTTDHKKNGLEVGLFLKPYLAMVSPYVLRFEDSEIQAHNVKVGPHPVAVFHGLGDCCDYPGMLSFTEYLRKNVGTYTRCVEVGDGTTSSWFMAFQSQSGEACAKIKADPEFANGLSVVGLSQGGLIARYIAEECGMTVHTVVTMGGPHMGVAKMPNCLSGYVCQLVNDALNQGVYSPFSQKHVGPAGYFKDQFDYSTYLKASNFLANLNNERSINTVYAQGVKNLDNLVLIKFTEDTVVDPPDSEWFGYFEEKTWDVQPMNQTADYANDVIGLQELYQQGKMAFIPIKGNHLQFTNQQFTDLVLPYLL